MLKKVFISTIIVMGLSTAVACAKSHTDLVKLASKQERLAQNINKAYKKQDKGLSALSVINTLESGYTKLKSDIHNAEINNLLLYLNICLSDLKKVVKQPYSTQNARKVSELCDSFSEGSHYIAASL